MSEGALEDGKKEEVPKTETAPLSEKAHHSSGDKLAETTIKVPKENAQARRIIAEDPEWNLAPIPKLKDLCVAVIVKNFEKNPKLQGLSENYREIVIDSISTELNLSIAASLISDPSYWKRRADTRFKLASVANHGNSWKRLFFELHIRDEIENLVPTTDYNAMEQKLAALKSSLTIAAPFVETLHLRQLKPLEIVPQPEDEEKALTATKKEGNKHSPVNHLSLNFILGTLRNVKDLSIYFGTDNCGFNFSWSFFGMTLDDAKNLCDGLHEITLESLSIMASRVDDEKCRLLSHTLLNYEYLANLDLSHNLIGNSGARGLAKLLATPKSNLKSLKLNNNQITVDGIKSIGKALQTNTKLTNLELRLNHLEDEGGYSLMVLLLKNRSIQSLDLSGNGLASKSVSALCALLKKNLPNLSRLDLSCNKLGEVTEKNAAGSTNNLATVPSNSNLSDAPKIVDHAGKAIFEAISMNKYLIHIDLRTTGISPEHLVAIQGIVSENSDSM